VGPFGDPFSFDFNLIIVYVKVTLTKGSNMDIELSRNQLEEIHQENLNSFYEFTQKSRSKNTLKAYFFAWEKYRNWCIDQKIDMYDVNIPKELIVGMFISDVAKKRNLKVASIQTYLAGIKYNYEEKGIPMDTRHPKIRAAMSGIRRTLGKKQTQKLALKTDAIKKIIASIDENSLIGLRDSAIILLGFSGAFRRSELVSIKIEHMVFDTYGLSIYIPNSKTDQEGEGRVVDIPFAKEEKFCPVRKIKTWISMANISEGYLFRRIRKGNVVQSEGITGHTVARIIKKRSDSFGFSSDVAGHSLRSGHVTSAIKNGTPETWIMRQTGHTNINTLRKYERLKREFVANSAANIGL